MTTVILNIENGAARAYVIPEGALRTEMDPHQDEFWSLYSSQPYQFESQRQRLVIDDLGEYTMLVSAEGDVEDKTLTAVQSAIDLVTGRLDTLREESRQQRRRTAVEALLESQGVKPKKAAKLAAALIETVDEVN